MSDPVLLGDELMSVLAGLRRRVRRKLRPQVPGPRLRGAHIELLRAVEARPGIGVSTAAQALHMAPNSVSTLVNQLLDNGMLSRQTDPDDRRAARLYLTGAAKHRLELWRKARSELVGGGIAQLSEPELDVLRRALPVLHSLLANLSTDETLEPGDGEAL
ncbi:MarR family winged helix-turn-helix transcriptional regulator [Saccharopolyspora phatthalungensis]|uniref:DNA-binding MarR family transcriptional regulator n=1 Tax=Saccharopolyspora phatthalungensis TaxID=664693 RepID=A0A840QFR1_9PSEU|nr:MarR family transcriptional regulator [Saccharopolyspora phatthalungensis]MBB5158911.1 DNA-binding MarR family transcriptional regulator [Saccharopolyspora phatthalungensis]